MTPVGSNAKPTNMHDRHKHGSRRDSAPEVRRPPAFIAKPWILGVTLVLITLAVYLPVHRHPFFTMDDDGYVANNTHLRGSFGEVLEWALTSYDLANWHPVTWFSHAADVHMFGSDPAGHHDVNLLLHSINVLALFWVLQRATGYAGRSFVAAALFALHPVNVETVAWIAERKTLLSMLFFLLALGAYRWYARKPALGRYAMVLVLYGLGLMAKPQIITFPFVLLLWDYWPLQRLSVRHSLFAFRQKVARPDSGEERNAKSEKRHLGELQWLFFEKVPLLALSLGSAIITMKAQSAAGAMRFYPLSVRAGNAIISYVHYLRNAFWPSRLAVFYPHPALAIWKVTGALLLLLAITAFVLLRREQRYLAVGWFWFLGTLVPMIGIVQVGEQAMADRYAYLSFVGLYVLMCWGVADLAERWRVTRAWVAAPACAVLLVLGILTHRQLSYWSDNVTLWSHMMTVSGGTYEVEENLGNALLDSGQTEAAMAHFQRVVEQVPAPSSMIGRELAGYAAVAHLYLGAYDQRRGRPQEGIQHFEQVLQLARDFTTQNVYAKVPPMLVRMEAVALGNMGDAYYTVGDFHQAKSSYESALRLGPLTAHQWMGLGMANQRSGNLPAAVEAYSRSTRLQVSDVGFLLLAQALEQSGRKPEAEAARQQARLVSPDFAAAERVVSNLIAQ